MFQNLLFVNRITQIHLGDWIFILLLVLQLYFWRDGLLYLLHMESAPFSSFYGLSDSETHPLKGSPFGLEPKLNPLFLTYELVSPLLKDARLLCVKFWSFVFIPFTSSVLYYHFFIFLSKKLCVHVRKAFGQNVKSYSCVLMII